MSTWHLGSFVFRVVIPSDHVRGIAQLYGVIQFFRRGKIWSPPSDEGLGKLWSHVASRSPSGAGVYPPSHPAVAFLHKWPVAPLLEFRSFSKALKKIPLLWHPKEMKNLSLKPVKAILFLNNDMSRLTRLLRILNAMKCCWHNSHSSFVVKCNDCCVLNGWRLVSL